MQSPQFYVEEDSAEEYATAAAAATASCPRLSFSKSFGEDASAMPVQSRYQRRFQLQSNKRTSDIRECQVTSPAHKTSKPDCWIRGLPSSTYNHNPKHEETSDDEQEFFSHLNARSNSNSCHTVDIRRDSSPFEVNLSRSQTADTSEEAAPLIPDSKTTNVNTIRFRSVSFCTGVPSSSRSLSSQRPSEPTAPNCSILESILLNRNIPAFYSALGSTGTRHNDSSDSSGYDDRRHYHPGDNYERPRLRSLPLSIAIPTNELRKGQTGQVHELPPWAMTGDDGPDEPICLSFKKRKVSLDGDYISEREISSTGIEDRSMSFDFGMRDKSSILHSLLTKTYSNADDQTSTDLDDSGQMVSSSSADREDTGSVSFVTLTNPGNSISHVDSTESLQTLEMLALADKSKQGMNYRHQRVAIAKKMQQVVNRKVRKWLKEIAQLAAKYRDLTNLPRDDWMILLRNALSRLLLLFMAENNFQFAVAPIACETLKTNDPTNLTTAVPPTEIPTNQSVEDIQRFIAKCQTLKVDGKEYHCMRLITLFHSGCGHGLQRIALVEQINSGACKILQELVRLSRPHDKLRYGELLLHLHSLASVNSRMVQRLFCLTRDEGGGNYAHIDESEWLF